jgi:dihydrofolate synthase/folylpolyglutamate synthase
VIGETRPELISVLQTEARAAVKSLEPDAEPDLRIVPASAEYMGALALRGGHQRRNAAVAEAVLEALPARYRPRAAAVRDGFARVTVPGRFDKRGKWLFDVAHNPDGIAALCRAIETEAPPRPIHALVSILGEKAWPEMLVQLDRVVDRGILTVTPSAAGRRWDLEWLRRWLKSPDRPPARASWHLVPEFPAALAEAERGAGTVLVTGSFHTVGDVMSVLGLGPI